MTAAELAERIPGAVRDGRGWKAPCSVHRPDTDPSVKWHDEGDRVLLRCHATCETEDVVAGYGLRMADLFHRPKERPGGAVIVATYDYTTVDGTVSYQTVRLLPKGFYQRRPDGQGGWITNLHGVESLIYRLPALQGQRRVAIVEGEADAHALAALGIAATTNHGGAGKWRPAHTAQLLAAGVERVACFTDNDRAGVLHRAKVAASCLAAGLDVVRVDLPGLGPVKDKHGEDVRDWFQLGHTAAELHALLEAAPPWAARDGSEILGPGPDPHEERRSAPQGPAGDPPDVAPLLAALAALGEHPAPAMLEGALRAIAAALAHADALTRAAVRAGVIETLTTLKVHGPAALADAALALERPSATAGQGRAMQFAAIAPWPEPVEGDALLSALVTMLRRFVVMSPEAADALALLIVHAHAHEASDISPIGVIASPTKRCGKTTALRLVAATSPRALATSNISPAAVFRTIEAHTPTLIVDEADTFVRLSEELRGILNAGHTRDLAYVVRTVGEDHEPRIFTTWCPKFLGLIGRLPDTLEDRAITLPLTRARKADKFEKLKTRQLRAAVDTLPAQCARWATDHLAALRDHAPAVPESLNDREGDNWTPVLAIADLCGGAWPGRARKAALALSGQGDPEEDEAGEAALRAVGEILTAAKDERMSSAALVKALTDDPTGRWVRYGKAEKPIDQRQLARLLGRFRIKPKQLWVDGTNVKGYTRDDLADALARYTPSAPQTPPSQGLGPLEPAPGAAIRDFGDPLDNPVLADAKSGSSPYEQRGLADLAPTRGGSGGVEGYLDPDDPANDLAEQAPLASDREEFESMARRRHRHRPATAEQRQAIGRALVVMIRQGGRLTRKNALDWLKGRLPARLGHSLDGDAEVLLTGLLIAQQLVETPEGVLVVGRDE